MNEIKVLTLNSSALTLFKAIEDSSWLQCVISASELRIVAACGIMSRWIIDMAEAPPTPVYLFIEDLMGGGEDIFMRQGKNHPSLNNLKKQERTCYNLKLFEKDHFHLG